MAAVGLSPEGRALLERSGRSPDARTLAPGGRHSVVSVCRRLGFLCVESSKGTSVPNVCGCVAEMTSGTAISNFFDLEKGGAFT